MKRLSTIVLLLVAILLLTALPAYAVTTINSAIFSCDSVTVTYESDDSKGWDAALITITNTDTAEEIYSHDFFDPPYSVWGGTYTIMFPEQPAGSNLLIEVQAGDSATASGACVPVPAESEASDLPEAPQGFTDGRFCVVPGIAMYGRQGGLDIYRINNLDKGDLVIRLTAQELADMAIMSNYSTADGFIQLFRLDELQYQVNVGPDAEDKVHVCIFDAVPDSGVFMTTFFNK